MSFTKIYAIDAATGLIARAPAQAAITATAYIGTQYDQQAATATDMVLVLNVEAIDISSTNEVYTFRIVGSNQTNRSDGEVLAMGILGHAATITIETRNTAAGDRIVIPFRTEKNRTRYRYVDLHLTAAGTTPSITFNAYFSKEI
jgi:hypothetical protein